MSVIAIYTVRRARPADLTTLAVRFAYDEVLDRETVRLFQGNVTRARVYLTKRAFRRNPERAYVAEYKGGLLGVLDYELPGDPRESRLRTLWELLRESRGKLDYRTLLGRVLVNTPYPDEAVVVDSVRVMPNWRGQGIGTRMLQVLDADAAFGNYRVMALQVLADNPAVHLYHREGFLTRDMKQHPWYLNRTARAMMVKAL